MKTVVVKSNNSRLVRAIEQGASIASQIKTLDLQLKAIKEDLEDLDPAKYVTKGGNSVTISETAKYSEINPDEAKKALRLKRLGRNFMDCIKVSVTVLKRYLSDEELEGLRKVQDYSRRYSFK